MGRRSTKRHRTQAKRKTRRGDQPRWKQTNFLSLPSRSMDGRRAHRLLARHLLAHYRRNGENKTLGDLAADFKAGRIAELHDYQMDQIGPPPEGPPPSPPPPIEDPHIAWEAFKGVVAQAVHALSGNDTPDCGAQHSSGPCKQLRAAFVCPNGTDGNGITCACPDGYVERGSATLIHKRCCPHAYDEDCEPPKATDEQFEDDHSDML